MSHPVLSPLVDSMRPCFTCHVFLSFTVYATCACLTYLSCFLCSCTHNGAHFDINSCRVVPQRCDLRWVLPVDCPGLFQQNSLTSDIHHPPLCSQQSQYLITRFEQVSSSPPQSTSLSLSPTHTHTHTRLSLNHPLFVSLIVHLQQNEFRCRASRKYPFPSHAWILPIRHIFGSARLPIVFLSDIRHAA